MAEAAFLEQRQEVRCLNTAYVQFTFNVLWEEIHDLLPSVFSLSSIVTKTIGEVRHQYLYHLQSFSLQHSGFCRHDISYYNLTVFSWCLKGIMQGNIGCKQLRYLIRNPRSNSIGSTWLGSVECRVFKILLDKFIGSSWVKLSQVL